MINAAAIQTIVGALLLAFLYATVGAGLSLQWGVTKILNFAYGEFLMIGGYATYFGVTAFHLSLGVSLLFSAVSAAAIAAVVYLTVLTRVIRSAEHNQLLATLGLSIVLQNLAIIIWTPSTRALHVQSVVPSFTVRGIVLDGNRIFVAIIGLSMYVVLAFIMKRTRYGILMRFASDDPELATYAGVNVRRAFGGSFVLGSAMAGVAGGLVALVLYVQPLVGQDFVIRAFAIIALGGLGSLVGVLVGALVLALSEGLVGAFVPNGASWGYGVAFLLLLLVLIARPNGIFGREQLSQ